MADVVDLQATREAKAASLVCDNGADEPHLSGLAFCQACRHEWVGVAPVGIVHLTCPNCGRRWGVFKNAVEPEVSWRHRCGEHLFFLTPAGAMCRGCGEITTDWV